MEFLTGLLASIIRPIIQAEIAELKKYIGTEIRKAQGVRATSKEASQLKEELKNATSNAEREKILEKIVGFSNSIDDGL